MHTYVHTHTHTHTLMYITHTHTHIRASAPLTLTGERADGTVASEDSTRPPAEDRLRGVRTTKLLEMSTLLQKAMHTEKFNALAVQLSINIIYICVYIYIYNMHVCMYVCIYVLRPN